MGITNSNKELSTARIDCGGSFQVRLSLTAAPDIVTNPTDIVLILDRSGSMAGSALSGWLTGMLLDKSSGIAMTAALMLAAGLAQLYCGIAYHKYQKPARNEE